MYSRNNSNTKAYLEVAEFIYKNNYIFELDPNAWYIMPGGYTSTLQMIDDLTLVIEAIK